jgi:uncharacterized membrane protein YhhN
MDTEDKVMHNAQDHERNAQTAPLGEDFFRMRKRRNLAIALGLVAFMVATFVFTIVKLTGNMTAP